jgi:phosphohistidine phosphatase SixA
VTSIHLIRHAKAKNRVEWTEPDDLRPLTKRGRREADALAERLAGEQLTRLVSSPYRRCVQTLEPLAVAGDLPIETTELLAEGAEGTDAVELLMSLAREGPVACCTHGDVLFDVIGVVAQSGVALDGPRDAPVASTWILDVESGRFASARFVEQPPR